MDAGQVHGIPAGIPVPVTAPLPPVVELRQKPGPASDGPGSGWRCAARRQMAASAPPTRSPKVVTLTESAP